MKKLFVMIPVIFLGACASNPTPPAIAKVPEFEVRMLNRTEVITAINQCETNDMKPFVEYITQKTEFGSKVMVPVNVHCDPIRRR